MTEHGVRLVGVLFPPAVTVERDNGGMLRIGTIVLNVKDGGRAAQFWSQALGYAYRDGGHDQDTTPVLLPQPPAETAGPAHPPSAPLGDRRPE